MQMGSHMGFQPGLVASRVSGMWCQDVCQGVAWLCTQLQAGRPHIGPTGQRPLGVPAALGCPHWSVVSQGWPCGHPGLHVFLPWEGAAPGRLRSGASVVGGDTCPNSALICQHTKLPPDCCPLLVFVNPKSGGLKGRDLLCSFRKLLNPHQVFELTNGGPLPG